ncbi:MAG TPA: FUSC family membrane protein [Stellaceae bacterium]|nr:FUSC family membrane protein [Stellaceae bacterium]
MFVPTGPLGLPRRAARLFFRHHIENGLAVAVCLAIVGIATGILFGIETAVLVGTGALCVSVVDQPGPLPGKLPVFLVTIVATGAISLLAGFAGGSVWQLATVIAVMSAGFALATAYGRTALVFGIAGVLSLVLGMAVPLGSPVEVLRHGALFVAGATGYATLALVGARLFDDRSRRMVLNEALLAFARYLYVRAQLYDPTMPMPTALRDVIEAHGALMERLQAARNAIFAGRPNPRRRRWIGGMLALLDIYEAVLASDADWETLRQTASGDVLAHFAALTRDLAHDMEGLALALVVPTAAVPSNRHVAALKALDAAFAANPPTEMRASLRTTRDAIAVAVRHVQLLAHIVAGSADRATALPDANLIAFVQTADTRLTTLRGHLTPTSPVMRYAIRLTLAMLVGYALTVAMPRYVHGGWILLTIALVMRANFAVTRQRRNDRIVGTLIGCAAAAVLVPLLPPMASLVLIIVAAGVAHAYATVDYRVASFAASVMALVLIHLLDPTEFLLINRIVDTLIGAGLSVAFSYLLPSWEWRDVPRLVGRLIDADRVFAGEALAPAPVDQRYRLARKRALDNFTVVATTTRRLSSEPGVRQRQLASLNALLGANYMLASDLASVQGLLRARGREIKPDDARAALEATRTRTLDLLTLKPETLPAPARLRRRGWTEMPASHALAFLGRRLRHIERAAQRTAALAARVTQPE